MRTLAAYLVSPALKLTGFRFSKDYRYGTTKFHKVIFTLVDTVKANNIAN